MFEMRQVLTNGQIIDSIMCGVVQIGSRHESRAVSFLIYSLDFFTWMDKSILRRGSRQIFNVKENIIAPRS